jgi:hypothetical protein
LRDLIFVPGRQFEPGFVVSGEYSDKNCATPCGYSDMGEAGRLDRLLASFLLRELFIVTCATQYSLLFEDQHCYVGVNGSRM